MKIACSLQKWVIWCICVIAFASCTYIEEPHNPTFPTVYTPVYMTRETLNNSVKLETPRPLKNTGKIFLKNPYLFIGERYEGVHVINNSDPRNPKNVAFIAIAGNVDVASKGNILYADNAVDLIALDIADINNIHVVKRLQDQFPEANQVRPPDGGDFNYDQSKGYIVGWNKND